MVWDKVWKMVYENKEWGRYPNEALIKFVAKNFFKEKDKTKIKKLKISCGLGTEFWLQFFYWNCKYMGNNSGDLIVM